MLIFTPSHLPASVTSITNIFTSLAAMDAAIAELESSETPCVEGFPAACTLSQQYDLDHAMSVS
jgi:hypothetical protein